MKWECIKELVGDQHRVNAAGRGGDIVNRVVPMYFQAFFAIPLYSTEGGTWLHKVYVLDGGTRIG